MRLGNFSTYFNDVKGLVDGGLLIEGESRVDLSGHLARHNVQNLLAKEDKEIVEGRIDLLLRALSVLLAICAGLIDELLVLGLLGRGEDQRWVGGSILWLVLANGGKVTRVTDNGL